MSTPNYDRPVNQLATP